MDSKGSPKKCKDCYDYLVHGFSPLCKYCKKDGTCPECGGLLRWNLTGESPYVCEKCSRFYEISGREVKRFNPSER